MEKHALDPIIVLKVNTSCCKECPEKLQKGLLMMNGINEVSVDPEKKLVSVRGNVNPSVLIEEISKMGKSAELMFYDKEPKLEGHQQKSAQCCREKDPYGDDHHKQNVGQNGGQKHFSCHDDDDDDDDEGFIHKDIMDEDMYKDSNYGRGPSKESESMFGNHTDHYKQAHFGSQSSRHDTGNSNYSWFREEPPPHEHFRPRMPPPPSPPPPSYSYGPFRGNRPTFQFHNYSRYFR